MKEFEPIDLAISVSAAEMSLTERQRDIIERHQQIFNNKLGDTDPQSEQAMEIYFETMKQVEGAQETYDLLDQLTDFNLARIMLKPRL